MLMGNFAHFVYFSPQDIVDGYVHCLKRLFEFSVPQNYLSPLHIPTTPYYFYSSASYTWNLPTYAHTHGTKITQSKTVDANLCSLTKFPAYKKFKYTIQ